MAIVGAYLIYRQVSQIREQSAAHYAEGIKWLVAYFMPEDRRFKDIVNGFNTAVQENNQLNTRHSLALILADVDLARHLIVMDYLTNDMLYAAVGLSLARVVEGVEPLLDAPSTREGVLSVISYRREAYDLMRAMKVIYDRESESADSWREGQAGDE